VRASRSTPLALALALALVLASPGSAAAQDSGCVHPDPTMGCPRTAPYTAGEVRALLATSAHNIRRCAWEFLGTHAPREITVTVPAVYTPRDPISVQPTTFGAPALDEQHFLECVAYYTTPNLPYRGDAITARLDLRMPRAAPTLEPAIRALLVAHATEIGECLEQGFPASRLLVVADARGHLTLAAIRSPTAAYDSSRGVPLGCAGYHIGRLSIAPPGREGAVEFAWPLAP